MTKCRIDWTLGAGIALFLWCSIDPGGLFLPFLLSASLHELGHYLALRAMGIPVEGIRLSLGGATMETGPMSEREELLCCAAGPVVNGLLLLLLAECAPLTALVSLCLMIYNLLPLETLDGGRILHGLLSLLLPAPVADGLCRWISFCTILGIVSLCAVMTCIWHMGLWPAFLGASVLLKSGALEKEKVRWVRNGRKWPIRKFSA